MDWNSFKKLFTEEGIDATPASKKFTIGRDTPFKLGQQYVLGLNLNHPEMHCHLKDADLAADDLTLGMLKDVTAQSPEDHK